MRRKSILFVPVRFLLLGYLLLSFSLLAELMHPFYKPSQHDDRAFYQAALKGVQAHHWEFGDMAAISSITREDMVKIISFIRWLQRELGIIK